MKAIGIFLGLLFVVFLTLAPKVLGIVNTGILTNLIIWTVLAVSLNMLLSYTGLLSFGHAIFFAAGAYATAIMLTNFDNLSLWLVLISGGVAAGLVALILSPMLVRARDTAFTMLTLAFGQLMFVICLKFRELTGGEDGLAAFPIPSLKLPMGVSLDLTDYLVFYYFALILMSTCIMLMWFITKTPFGNLMIGIRDNQNRIAFLGYNVPLTKALIFVFSAFFAGIAGSTFALYQNVVSTDGVANLRVSFLPLMAILIGGIGTFSGPMIGMLLLLLLEQTVARFTSHVEFVSGLVFIFFILYLPGGLAWYWRVLVNIWPWKRQLKADMAP